MSNRRSLILLAAALPCLVHAAQSPPTPKDYASGLSLELAEGASAGELAVPDLAYAGVLRADLGDLRVFNAAGIAVPHALCPPEAWPAPTAQEQVLPVFELRAGKLTPLGAGARIDLVTPGGTQLRVEEPGAPGAKPAAQGIAAYVIDARSVPEPLDALRVEWSTEDGASEVQVRVEASEDLDRWSPVIASTTLLHGTAGPGQSLDRTRILLPGAGYAYLRLERSDGGPPPRIGKVVAEWQQRGPAAPPVWFVPVPEPIAEVDGALLYDARQLSPVHAAQLQLPMANMALRVALDSRADPKQPWSVRWNGDVNSVAATSGTQPPARLEFAQTADRYWRLRFVQGVESLGATRPLLQLGYRPARLRFLAQGAGPYLLAFGSARAEVPAPRDCDALLGNVAPEQLVRMLGEVKVSFAPGARFGGAEAMLPPPKKVPVRQFVLWGVLLVGVLLVGAIAFSQLKRLQPSGS